jgi:hypothetical protein
MAKVQLIFAIIGFAENSSLVFINLGVTMVAEVPSEAHNVRVEEMTNARTFIALGASEKKLFIDGRR